jgi:hypothetical protein
MKKLLKISIWMFQPFLKRKEIYIRRKFKVK